MIGIKKVKFGFGISIIIDGEHTFIGFLLFDKLKGTIKYNFFRFSYKIKD